MLQIPMHVIIREFKIECPSFARDAVEYIESSKPLSILVRLNDGRLIEYDFNNKGTLNVREEEITDENIMRRRFSRNLDRAMIVYGYTQQSLSEKTGISQATISRYLNEQSDPSYINIIRIENALGCERGSLTEFFPKPKPNGERQPG